MTQYNPVCKFKLLKFKFVYNLIYLLPKYKLEKCIVFFINSHQIPTAYVIKQNYQIQIIKYYNLSVYIQISIILIVFKEFIIVLM